MDRFISGELGSNLLFKYKAISFLSGVDTLVAVLSKALKTVITKKYGVLNEAQLEFIDQICLFSGFRGKVWKPPHKRYRLLVLSESNFPSSPHSKYNVKPKEY